MSAPATASKAPRPKISFLKELGAALLFPLGAVVLMDGGLFALHLLDLRHFRREARAGGYELLERTASRETVYKQEKFLLFDEFTTVKCQTFNARSIPEGRPAKLTFCKPGNGDYAMNIEPAPPSTPAPAVSSVSPRKLPWPPGPR